MKNILVRFLAITATAGLLFTGCGGVDPKAEFLGINDGKDAIASGYANFFMKYSQANFESMYMSYYGEGDLWGQDMGSGVTYEDTFKEDLVTGLKEHYVAKEHAKDYDIVISEEDKKSIETTADEFLESNTSKAIKQMGATKEFIVTYLENLTYYYRVRDAVKAETEVSITDEEAVQSTITYAFFSTADTTDDEGNTVTLSEEEKQKLQADAQSLVDAEDFDGKATELGVTPNTYSYTTSKEASEDLTLGEEIITAAKELADGGKTLVTLDEGYYVIRMDAVNDSDATATKRSELEEERKQTAFEEKMTGWVDEYTWKLNEAELSKIKFDKSFSEMGE